MHCTLYYYTIQRTTLYANNKASRYVQHTWRKTTYNTQRETMHNNNTHAQGGRERQYTQKKRKRKTVCIRKDSTYTNNAHIQRETVYTAVITTTVQKKIACIKRDGMHSNNARTKIVQ